MGNIKTRIAPYFEGAYDSTKVYKKLSVVSYDDNLYIAFVDEVPAGILPTNEDYYKLYLDSKSNIEKTNTRFSNIENRLTEVEDDVLNLTSARIRKWGVRYYYGQSSSKLERLGDAIGMTANATKNGEAVVDDFDEEELFKEIKKVKRHETTHKLLAVKGDADYDSVIGEVMIDFPDTYWKIEEAADKTYIDVWLSNALLAGFFKVDKFSVGAHSLSIAEDGSIQTQPGFPVEGHKNITTWRNLVKEQYGEGACLMDWRYTVITYLYLIEFADFNSQSVLGNGLHSFRYNATTDKALIAETGVN